MIIDGILPEEILCISFTKSAAKNLEEKLNQEDIFIKVKTFHSLGYEIINEYRKIKLSDEKILSNIIEEKLKNNRYLKNITDAKFIRLGGSDPVFLKLEHNIILNSKIKEHLKEIIITFINLYRSSNNKISSFKQFKEINNKNNIYDKKKRHNQFLKLVKDIIINYEKTLIRKQQIDFHSMINDSIKIVKKKGIYPYKYIIIDEYQDTSLNKTYLIKEIQNKTGAKLMVVGDDWQSIYGFTGSNLEIFINFKKIFPKAKILKLKYTYRNSKELLDLTRKFICKNSSQIPKKLKTKKRNKHPIHIYYYDKSIEEVWEKIVKEVKNTKTFILSRNNKDIYQIPYLNKNMKFLTMHKSKGLESENTIIINLEDNYNSIPSKIKESEYLNYVKPKTDKFKYAEERRLFYVALTRCKNNNYLLVKKNNSSVFVKEIVNNYLKYIEIK